MVKKVTIEKALQYVVDHPVPATNELIELPVYELVARALFSIANSPDVKVRGSARRATIAQTIIANRMVGLRKPGTGPLRPQGTSVEFFDLTQGALE